MRPSSMHLSVLLFGQLKERGGAHAAWQVEDGAVAGDVLARLEREGTMGEALAQSCALAVNREYVARDFLLHDGDEVAVLPPVSGGAL